MHFRPNLTNSKYSFLAPTSNIIDAFHAAIGPLIHFSVLKQAQYNNHHGFELQSLTTPKHLGHGSFPHNSSCLGQYPDPVSANLNKTGTVVQTIWCRFIIYITGAYYTTYSSLLIVQYLVTFQTFSTFLEWAVEFKTPQNHHCKILVLKHAYLVSGFIPF